MDAERSQNKWEEMQRRMKERWATMMAQAQLGLNRVLGRITTEDHLGHDETEDSYPIRIREGDTITVQHPERDLTVTGKVHFTYWAEASNGVLGSANISLVNDKLLSNKLKDQLNNLATWEETALAEKPESKTEGQPTTLKPSLSHRFVQVGDEVIVMEGQGRARFLLKGFIHDITFDGAGALISVKKKEASEVID